MPKAKVIKLVPKRAENIIKVPEPHNEAMKNLQARFVQFQTAIQDLQLRFTIETQNGALEAGLSKVDLNSRILSQDPNGSWQWVIKETAE